MIPGLGRGIGVGMWNEDRTITIVGPSRRVSVMGSALLGTALLSSALNAAIQPATQTVLSVCPSCDLHGAIREGFGLQPTKFNIDHRKCALPTACTCEGYSTKPGCGMNVQGYPGTSAGLFH